MTHRPARRPSPPGRAQRGAALLLAMLILTLVSTLAASMVWQQWRAVEVEAAERTRAQSAWILGGALDWARLILREDGRSGGADHLGEPWAVPLAEARLSTFLAADSENNVAGDEGPDAFLSGAITDAQSRYNLHNLVDGAGKPVAAQLQVLQRICEAAGLPSDSAGRIASGLIAAWAGAPEAPIAPSKVAQLTWLGLDPSAAAALQRWVVLLPAPTTLNLNTASTELVAAVTGLDAGSAQLLVERRQRAPFKTLQEAQTLLPEAKLDTAGVGVASSYFEVQGRLRLADRVLEERSLVVRNRQDVTALQRERVNLWAGSR